MQAIAYLNFNGCCEEAFRFYERVLNGRIEAMLRHDGPEMAEHTTPEWRDKIMHACMIVGETRIMASDAIAGMYTKPAGIYVSLHLRDVREGERIFNALADNGTITMPFEKTFWAERFGMLVDRFDIPWMINCDPNAFDCPQP